ncbi:MAG: hypothetical protein ACEPOW_03360 [Bacteroidales bacterium]
MNVFLNSPFWKGRILVFTSILMFLFLSCTTLESPVVKCTYKYENLSSSKIDIQVFHNGNTEFLSIEEGKYVLKENTILEGDLCVPFVGVDSVYIIKDDQDKSVYYRHGPKAGNILDISNYSERLQDERSESTWVFSFID